MAAAAGHSQHATCRWTIHRNNLTFPAMPVVCLCSKVLLRKTNLITVKFCIHPSSSNYCSYMFNHFFIGFERVDSLVYSSSLWVDCSLNVYLIAFYLEIKCCSLNCSCPMFCLGGGSVHLHYSDHNIWCTVWKLKLSSHLQRGVKG